MLLLVVCLSFNMMQFFFWIMIWKKAQKLELMLCTFEQISSLNSNFRKRRYIHVWRCPKTNLTVHISTLLFHCKSSASPMHYLGTLIHYRKIREM
jgi:hypothetical protein